MISTELWTWVYAFFVIGYWSQLAKDNPWYWFTEHIFIGIAAAHGLVMSYWSLRSIAIPPLMEGNYFWLFVLILGFLVLFRFVRAYRWVSNWLIAILFGVSTGLAARGAIETQILRQIRATFELSKIAFPFDMFSNAIFIITTIYTYFTSSTP